LSLVLVCAWFEPIFSAARASAPESFRARSGLDLRTLESVVGKFSPNMASERGNVAVAEAERSQSRLFSNPTLSASWGTLPVGTTNPPNLAHPYANVPNYAASLGYTFPLNKRGPRMRQADAALAAHNASLLATRRGLAMQLSGILAQLAADMLRLSGMEALTADARHDLEVGESRLKATFAAPLDVDRLGLEVRRSEQRLASARSDLAHELANCAALLGVPCEPFDSADEARKYLEEWLGTVPTAAPDPEHRQDLVALRELSRASEAERELARAERVPDPTVAFGYMHDRFIISGNQRNSLNMSVSVPLPVFDHGQARAQAAESRRNALEAEHQARYQAALATTPTLRKQLEQQRARQRELTGEVLPRARDIVSQLERAVESRLVPIGDLLQARRTLDELLIEEADSYADAFSALLGLLAETGESPALTVVEKRP
jgi:cobalt-zinc-cadmium efflux system outer membrane protein